MTVLIVLYIPGLQFNLLSANKLKAKGIYFNGLTNTLRLIDGNNIIAVYPRDSSINTMVLKHDKHPKLTSYYYIVPPIIAAPAVVAAPKAPATPLLTTSPSLLEAEDNPLLVIPTDKPLLPNK